MQPRPDAGLPVKAPVAYEPVVEAVVPYDAVNPCWKPRVDAIPFPVSVMFPLNVALVSDIEVAADAVTVGVTTVHALVSKVVSLP
ncbi:Uncharacterised protein [uncultured archaeon]|nr:Uncharacterised protein [uncultured archaeon]